MKPKMSWRVRFMVLLTLLAVPGLLNFVGQGSEQALSSLVASWAFEEGEGSILFDNTKNDNDGILMCADEACSPGVWTQGKIGKALKLDGLDDYVMVPYSESLDIIDTEFTVSVWYKTSISNGGYLITQFGITGGYRLYMHSRVGLYFEVSSESGTVGIYNREGVSYSDNEWHNAVAVRDRDRLLLYVDGTEVATGSRTIGSIANTADLYIGARDATQDYLDGSIDEVRIYNRALTEDEIKELYQEGQLEG